MTEDAPNTSPQPTISPTPAGQTPRERAKTYLAKVNKTEIRSDNDAALFNELTKQTHEKLMANWLTGGYQTCCIDFVCVYAAKLGIDIIGPIPKAQYNKNTDGYFQLEETLKKAGLSHCFVSAKTPGAKPKYGDILRHVAFHVDVCTGWVGEKMYRIQGGNSSHPRHPKDKDGNKIEGYPLEEDKVKIRKEYDNVMKMTPKTDYDSKAILGWLDIDKYFGATSPEITVDEKTGSLWRNRNNELVHPDAPSGGGGPGFFRYAGSTGGEFLDFPHPDSAAARTLDPLELERRSRARRMS